MRPLVFSLPFFSKKKKNLFLVPLALLRLLRMPASRRRRSSRGRARTMDRSSPDRSMDETTVTSLSNEALTLALSARNLSTRGSRAAREARLRTALPASRRDRSPSRSRSPRSPSPSDGRSDRRHTRSRSRSLSPELSYVRRRRTRTPSPYRERTRVYP